MPESRMFLYFDDFWEIIKIFDDFWEIIKIQIITVIPKMIQKWFTVFTVQKRPAFENYINL